MLILHFCHGFHIITLISRIKQELQEFTSIPCIIYFTHNIKHSIRSKYPKYNFNKQIRVFRAPCGFRVSRIEPLCSPARRKMEASRRLPAGAIPSVVEV